MPDADFEQVARASELAMANEFIRELPDQFESFAGEKGVLLSGGQRQRIAIARALLRQPKLLILDEPTNHFDRAASRQLMRNLQNMEHGPAILIITHDMDIVREAAHVYVIEAGGRIGAEGSPEILFQKEVSVDAR